MSSVPVSPARVLGTAAVAFASVNWIIGAGIFGLPALAAAALGPAAVVGYVVSAIVLGMVGLCLAEAGSRVTSAGGPYAYVTVSFGPIAGGVIGTMMWTSCVTASAAVANLWLDTLANAWPRLSSGAARVPLIAVFYLALALVNVRGARQGSRLSVALAIAKLVPLIAIVLIGMVAIDPAKLHWTRVPSVVEFGNATVLLFYTFVGIEGGLYASAEIRDPRRTIPRALLLTTLIIAALYIGLQVVAQGVLGAELPKTSAPLVSIADVLLGPWGARLMMFAIVVSTSGYLVADALCSPRAIYALAERDQLPAFFGRLHPRFGTPAGAICVYMALCTLLAITGSFRPLAIFTSSATLVVYGGCCLGLLRLRSRGIAQAGTPFRAPGGALLPLGTAALILWLLASLSREEMLATVLPMVLAAVGYAAQRRMRKAPEMALPLD